MVRESKFSKEELYQTTKSILLKKGYFGFTFSILAQRLDVSRGTIYKSYKNKDELITEYMNVEMGCFLNELSKIEQYDQFDAQFDYAIETILHFNEIRQIVGFLYQLSNGKNKKVMKNIEQLQTYHEQMYTYLQKLVQLGKKEGHFRSDISNNVLLGVILQMVTMPNHEGIQESEWRELIKEMIRHGISNVN